MGDVPERDWTRADLANPARAASVFVVLAGSFFVSQLAACNVHELGHAAVAIPLGWEIDTIRWCAPGAGGVDYSNVGRWAGNLQGYAGGAIAALFLFAFYSRAISHRSRPNQSPEWWAAGLGVVVWIGPQLVIGLMEGTARPNEDYTDLFETHPRVFVPLLVLAALLGSGLYLWRWRRDPSPTDE